MCCIARHHVFVCRIDLGVIIFVFVFIAIVIASWLIGGGLCSPFRYIYRKCIEDLHSLRLSFEDDRLGDEWRDKDSIHIHIVADIHGPE